MNILRKNDGGVVQRVIITTAAAATSIPTVCRRVGRSWSVQAASRMVEAGYRDASTAATSSLPARVDAIKSRLPEVSSAAAPATHRRAIRVSRPSLNELRQ